MPFEKENINNQGFYKKRKHCIQLGKKSYKLDSYEYTWLSQLDLPSPRIGLWEMEARSVFKAWVFYASFYAVKIRNRLETFGDFSNL